MSEARDILVNNAGCWPDKTRSKLNLKELRLLFDVPPIRAFHHTKGVWEHMNMKVESPSRKRALVLRPSVGRSATH
jgi:NADP-dependent 3-hydroxy acid dehydrogenase YdfG